MMARFVVAVALATLLAVASLAQAQTGQSRSPLGVPLPPAAERGAQTQPNAPAAAPAGVVESAWAWLLATQQRLNRELAAAVKAIKGDGNIAWSASVLAFIGFAYGVVHAAGPGHGKAVISSYVLASERTVRRGILLSFMAAFVQALSAIAIVGLLAIAMRATSLQIRAAESWIETISWAFVAIVGAWLLLAQVRKLQRTGAVRPAAPKADHHSCGHGHARAHACADDHRPDAAHHDAHDGCCAHAHMPAPADLEGRWSWGKALALAVSVGIRPCTGAILVLVFALSQGLLWAGIFATFAMALGTAITVSALAALAVGSRELATRLAGGESRWGRRIEAAAGLIGATLVLVMGSAFFIASLQGSGPL
jgi:ABC-type nickel/cobalt efflux system permease component RcnA